MNAAKEARADNMTVAEGLSKIGTAFLSTREVSSQECVYCSMPELWFRKIFPLELYLSVLTYLRKEYVYLRKEYVSQQELKDLDDDNTDISKSNIVECYGIRPDSFPCIGKLCLAELAAYYYKDYRKRL